MKKYIKQIVIAFFIILLGVAALATYQHYKKTREPVPPIPNYIYKMYHTDTVKNKYILMAPYPTNRWWHGRLIIMDFSGKIIMQKYVKGSAYNFRQWQINGKTYYSYFVNDQRVMHIKGIKLAAGVIILTDSALNEIKRITYIDNDSIVSKKKQGLDPHDLILFSEQHYITVSEYYKVAIDIPDSLHPSPYLKIAVPLIQEVENGKLIWQWDAANYTEFYATSVENNHFTDSSMVADYLHINSLKLDPKDSNLICSFKNNNQIIKINRKTGNIIWRLGGKTSDFALTVEQKFLRQHDAKFIDNGATLLLLDNGDSATRQVSRVLEFKLDEVHKKVIGFKSFTIPTHYCQYMGSVDKIGDSYFICGGSANYIMEINTVTGKINFELHANLSSYRAYIVDDISGIRVR